MYLKIRDKRNRGWFYLDNIIIDKYGSYIGTIGIAVYVSLCRHADSNQICFPSQKTIGREIGVTDRTVRDYLKKLISLRFIDSSRRVIRGKLLNNVYTLLDKSLWVLPEEVVSSGTHRKQLRPLEENQGKIERNQVPHKYTNSKETHLRNRNDEGIEKIKKEINDKFKV